ncbi:PfkB family carbohydrate kinase [Georgenia sp. 10Sc9-8]|uniref:PfkB family carbohydrate kinase n=1 Tax=Georgenia halotolerans TaxID=3028317 RepID=A0ABT5TYL3_9MICO|nr:PfkB family carbohydrate kinase [Georgenia halotolerans]
MKGRRQMKVVVVGIATHQTSVPVESFPVTYEPLRARTGEIEARAGGPGFVVARALASLGDVVVMAAPLGEDAAAATVDSQSYRYGFTTSLCSRTLTRTPRLVILHDRQGRESVFTDLGNALDVTFDERELSAALVEADAVAMSGPELARAVAPLARRAGTPFAVDLQQADAPDETVVRDLSGAALLVVDGRAMAGRAHDLLPELRAHHTAEVVVAVTGRGSAVVLGGGVTAPRRVAVGRGEAQTGPGPGSDDHVPTAGGSSADVFFAALVHRLLALGQEPEQATGEACIDTVSVLTALGG